MIETVAAIGCFLFGLVFIWQGVRRLQGKRGARPDAITQMAMSSMSEEDQDRTLKVHAASNKAMGAMRIVFGLFVIAMGVYLLV